MVEVPVTVVLPFPVTEVIVEAPEVVVEVVEPFKVEDGVYGKDQILVSVLEVASHEAFDVVGSQGQT